MHIYSNYKETRTSNYTEIAKYSYGIWKTIIKIQKGVNFTNPMNIYIYVRLNNTLSVIERFLIYFTFFTDVSRSNLACKLIIEC